MGIFPRRCRRRWKDDYFSKAMILIFFTAAPAYALPDIPGLGNVNDGTRLIIMLVFLGAGVMLLRGLTKFDRNQDELFRRMREAEADIKAIKAVCKERDC